MIPKMGIYSLLLHVTLALEEIFWHLLPLKEVKENETRVQDMLTTNVSCQILYHPMNYKYGWVRDIFTPSALRGVLYQF